MNKLMCLLAFALSLFSVHAQTQKTENVLPVLTEKVDSLEHELAFLRLDYEIKTLNYDITMFADEMDAKSSAISLNLYTGNFDYRLKNAYSQNFESCLAKKQSMSELVKSKKRYIYARIMTYPYSDAELDMLMGGYRIIDKAWDSLEKSMDLLKVTLDAYSDSM